MAAAVTGVTAVVIEHARLTVTVCKNSVAFILAQLPSAKIVHEFHVPTPVQEEKLVVPGADWSVERIVKEAAPRGWLSVFQASQAELIKISNLLIKDHKEFGPFLPPRAKLFNAFHLTPLEDVRVVIIGQDPYHSLDDQTGDPIAQGLSFSVAHGMKVPPSLRNIFTEIKNCYPEFKTPTHGCLEAWAKQGVLMLNSCLTVRQGTAGCHSEYSLWMPFVIKVLDAISKVRPNCIYVMWGAHAQKLQQHLNGASIKLTSAHPSPYSAERGFFGCKHFKTINTHLTKDPKGPINWQI